MDDHDGTQNTGLLKPCIHRFARLHKGHFAVNSEYVLRSHIHPIPNKIPALAVQRALSVRIARKIIKPADEICSFVSSEWTATETRTADYRVTTLQVSR